MPVNNTGKESRINWRRRALKTGTVWFNDDYSTMHCQVRDLSITGARIKFVQEFACPKQIKLQIPGGELEGPIMRAERVWIREREVGIRFTDGDTFELPSRLGQRMPIKEVAVLSADAVSFNGTTDDISGSGALISKISDDFDLDQLEVAIHKLGEFGASVVRKEEDVVAVKFDHNEEDQNALQKKLDEFRRENDPEKD